MKLMKLYLMMHKFKVIENFNNKQKLIESRFPPHKILLQKKMSLKKLYATCI
jgi:hypothetical protein